MLPLIRAFLRIKIKDNETIEDLLIGFFYDAQILMKCGSHFTYIAKTALKYALESPIPCVLPWYNFWQTNAKF